MLKNADFRGFFFRIFNWNTDYTDWTDLHGIFYRKN